MSILLIDKTTNQQKLLKIDLQFVNTVVLKKLAISQLKCNITQLRLYHHQSDIEYSQIQVIKQGQKVSYQIIDPYKLNQTQSFRTKGIVYPEQLQKIIQNSKIIVIKSANQENIQKSKQCSLWATTYSNQQRLKYFFHNFSHVLLLFATNRSYEIKGLARMQSQPDKITDKTVWSGVTNIRLGGNFKIKWLRKKGLSLVAVEKNLGTNFKQNIIKCCDGQELDPYSCKKLAYLFQTPQQPYYSVQDKIQASIPRQKQENSNIKESYQQVPNFPSILINPLVQVTPYHLQSNKFSNYKRQSVKNLQSQDQESYQSKQLKKSKKDKKDKKKKIKKSKKSHKKKHKKYSSSSQQSSSDQSSSSSRSSQKKDKKKNKKRKKHSKKHS